jgi:hypothetical protein
MVYYTYINGTNRTYYNTLGGVIVEKKETMFLQISGDLLEVISDGTFNIKFNQAGLTDMDIEKITCYCEKLSEIFANAMERKILSLKQEGEMNE